MFDRQSKRAEEGIMVAAVAGRRAVVPLVLAAPLATMRWPAQAG